VNLTRRNITQGAERHNIRNNRFCNFGLCAESLSVGGERSTRSFWASHNDYILSKGRRGHSGPVDGKWWATMLPVRGKPEARCGDAAVSITWRQNLAAGHNVVPYPAWRGIRAFWYEDSIAMYSQYSRNTWITIVKILIGNLARFDKIRASCPVPSREKWRHVNVSEDVSHLNRDTFQGAWKDRRRPSCWERSCPG